MIIRKIFGCVVSCCLVFAASARAESLSVTLPSAQNLLYAQGIAGQSINWTNNGVAGLVKIDLWKSGSFHSNIADNLPATDSTYTWNVPGGLGQGGDYRVRVISKANPLVFDESDFDFAVVGPYISLISPGTSPGNKLIRGSTAQVRWTSNVGGTVTVQLKKGNATATTLTSTRANSYYGFETFYNWSIPANQAPGADYKIILTTNTDGYTSQSTSEFEIGDLQVNVLAPTSATIWPVGTNQTIIFNTELSDFYTIDLYKGTTLITPPIVSNTFYFSGFPPNQFAGWNIPANLAPGNDYKIRFTPNSSSGFKESDSFTISGVLNVLKPASFVEWGVGGNHAITWESLAGGNVRIELFDSNGVSTTIVDPAPNTGSYTWNVPSTQDQGVFTIKITSLNDNTSDFSDQFILTTPNINLTYPGGGEKLGKGRTHEIQWTSNLEGNVKIELFKGGNLDSPIILNTPNDGKHPWTISAGQTDGQDYRVKITSIETPSVNSQGFADCTIGSPSITVTNPNTAIVGLISPNEILFINWISNLPQEKVKIELLKNGNVSALISASEDNVGSYSFPIPSNQTPGNNYKIRVSTIDGLVTDSSDVDFSFETPSITLTSPNGGQTWLAGSSQVISWTSNMPQFEAVQIELLKGGSVAHDFGAQSNFGSLNVTLPATLTPDVDYKIRISTLNRTPNVNDSSDGNFSILPRLHVEAPNGGEQWPQGTAKTIQWTSDLLGTVTIQLYKSGNLHSTIVANAPDTGSFSWNIPPTLATGFDYRIKIIDDLDNAILDDSDGNFLIVQRFITLTSPTGGQDWALGKPWSITWNSNFSSNVKIELLSGNPTETIVGSYQSFAQGNSFTWNIPLNQSVRSDYKIRISDTIENTIKSESQEFSINLPKITIAAPNGTEQLVRGTQVGIYWSANFSATFKVDLLKGANAPVPILANTDNTSYIWQIPANQQPAGDYKIRVSTFDGTVMDESNDFFSVIAHSVTVSAPNGTEVYSAGTYLPITWTSNFQSASNVKIELLKVGSPPFEIEASVFNSHSYSWLIPELQTVGNNYSIRITSVLDILATDTSDGTFQIRPNQPPVANAGPDQTVKETKIGFAAVTLNGSASTDDGSINPLIYTWKKGATVLGTPGTSSSLQLDLPLGSNVITLTVDDGRLTSSDTVIINVLANVAPVANAGPDQTVTQELLSGKNVTLSAGLTADDGSFHALTYVWKEGNTVISNDPLFDMVFSVGQHTLTLTVNDGQYDSSDTVVVTVLPVPNLTVSNIVVPSEAFTGSNFDVTWTITNTGAATAVGPWADHLYLSEDALAGGDIDLGAFVFTGTLAPGESITRTQVVKVNNAQGFQDKAYRILINTDGLGPNLDNGVYEGPYENDNVMASTPINVHPLPLPDLIVESISAPASAFANETLTIQYVILNQGTGGTDLPTWNDRLYISVNSTPSGLDPVQVVIPNVSALAPGERYTGTVSVKLPEAALNQHYIIIKTNEADRLLEEVSSNNTRNKILQIDVPSTADLQITQASANDEGASGLPVLANWTIENKGNVQANPSNGRIQDRIYLSTDMTLSGDDTLLDIVDHVGSIAVNEGYVVRARSVVLPKRISGQYYLIIQTDAQGTVFEFSGEGNNTRAIPINIIRSPDPDLIVEAVNPPSTAMGGKNLALSWTVFNQGGGDTDSSWTDGIYLSTDQTLSNDDIVIGGIRNAFLGSQTRYTKSASLALSQELAGDYYVIIRANILEPNGRIPLVEFDPSIDATANNIRVSASPVHITWTPPDLQVTSVSAPATALASKYIPVTWTVKNFGPGETYGNEIVDEVYISMAATLPNNALKLGIFDHSALDSGVSYTRTESMRLPVDLAAGNYYIFVKTDSKNDIKETGHEDNNIGRTALTVTVDNTPPDLIVTAINNPVSIPSGRTFEFNYVVKNVGTGPTQYDAVWGDQVYLSKDTVVNRNDPNADILLLTNEGNHAGSIAVNGTYTATVRYKVPYELSGTYYLIVATDTDESVFESLDNNNLKVSAPFIITATPAPDLKVNAIALTPSAAQSGQFVNVAYTVINNGSGTTDSDTPTWVDRIQISRDQVLDPSDEILGETIHTGVLASAGTYQDTFRIELPRNISGPYYIFVTTDVKNKVFEANDKNNSSFVPLAVTLAPPADLIVENTIVVPAGGMPGDSRTFAWTVTNVGLNKADGVWTDNVYLSRDGVLDFEDKLIASVVQNNRVLQPNNSYTEMKTINLPALLPGNYYVIVRSDVRDNIRESNELNNNRVSATTLAMDIPELTLNVPAQGILNQDEVRYYKVNVPDKTDLLIDLDSAVTTSFNDLFVARTYLPTQGFYEFSHDDPYKSDQQILLPEVEGGYFYIMVRGNKVTNTNPDYTITARALQFSIVDATPNKGSNAGRITTQIRGAKFTTLSTAKLVSGAVERSATRMYFSNSTKIFATFDLTGLAAGTFDLQVIDQANTATLTKGFTVTNPSSLLQGPLLTAIFCPPGLRTGTVAALSVGYSNTTENDLEAPLFKPYADFSKMRLNEKLAYSTIGESVIGINFKGPAGILPPGARSSISYKYTNTRNQSITANHNLPQYTTASTYAMDWVAVEKSARPPLMSDATWAPMWANFLQRAGPTYGGFIKVLDETATGLSDRGEYFYRVADLFRFALNDSFTRSLVNVSGRVFLKDVGHPLKANETVTIYSATSDKGFTAQTRGDGSFVFDRVPVGTYSVSVDGYVLASPVQFTLAATPITLPQVIVTVGATISGVVRDVANKALSGVTVAAENDAGTPFNTTTDANGAYRLSGLVAGKYTVRAGFIDGYSTPMRTGVELATATSAIAGIDFILSPPVTLSGLVRQATNGPVLANVSVMLQKDGEPLGSAFTDATGKFEIANVIPGTFDVVLKRSGYATKVISSYVLSPNQLKVDTFEMQLGAKFTVTVTKASVPVADASVSIELTGVSELPVNSDASGVAVFQDLPAGDYVVKADHEVNGKTSVNVTLAVGEQRALSVPYPAVGKISGTITLQPSGTPVKATRVMALRQSDGISFDTVSDETGSYTLNALPDGVFAVFVQSGGTTGIGRRDVTVVAGNNYTQNFVLTGGSINGTLFKNGGTTPAAFATATLCSNNAVLMSSNCDQDGKYCFTAVPPGTYQIEGTGQDIVFDKANITLASGQIATGVNLSGGGQTLIVNVARRNSNVAVVNGAATVRFSANHVLESVAAKPADDSGVITFSGMLPGDYTLSVGGSGLADATATVTIPPTGPTSITVLLDPEAPLAVTVKNGSNALIADAAVYAYLPNQAVALSAATSDVNGLATLKSLAAGTYDVCVYAPGYGMKTQSGVVVSGANSALNVVLTPSTITVSGTLSDQATSMPLIGAVVIVRDAHGREAGTASTDFNGNYSINTLPPESCSVTAFADGYLDLGLAPISATGTRNATMVSVGAPDPLGIIAAALLARKIAIEAKKYIDEHNPMAMREDTPEDDIVGEILCPKTEILKAHEKCYTLRGLKREALKAWANQNSNYNWKVGGITFEFGLRVAVVAGSLASLHPALQAAKGPFLASKLLKIKLSGKETQLVLNGISAAGNIAATISQLIFDPPNGYFGDLGIRLNLAQAADNLRVIRASLKFLPEDVIGLIPYLGTANTLLEQIKAVTEISARLDELSGFVKMAKDAYHTLVLNYQRAKKEYQRLNQKCDEDPPKPDPVYIDLDPDECELGVSPPGSDVCDPPTNHDPGQPPYIPPPNIPPPPPAPTDWRAPKDPNEKRGPEGFGASRFVSGKQSMTYTVLCENVATSTAPVQKLTIDDQLDTSLDLRTFRIKEIVLGENVISVPENRAIFSGRTQLGADQGGIGIDVFAGVDVFTGKVFLRATATDPETGERPKLPDYGFMPPNDATHRGEGHIVYSVTPKSGLATGTKISNTATIIFDALEIIDTNTVENKVDSIAPVSGLAVLPAQNETSTIQLSWSGADEAQGSGLRDFDIYVSDNNGPFKLWLGATTETSATFAGEIGHTYRFYTIARDNVGNEEETPAVPETQVEFVAHINRAPTTTGIADVSVTDEVATTTLNLRASFNDLEDGAAGLTYTVKSNSNPALFTSVPINDALDALTLNYSGTAGVSNITVRATDSGGLFVESTFKVTFTVIPKIPPTITSKLADTGTVGTAYSYTITASGDQPVTFSATNLPGGLSFAGALISGTPTTAGSFDIKLDATNKHGTDTKTLRLVVVKLNAAPTTIGIADISVTEDVQETVIDVSSVFDDAEDGAANLTYTVTSNSNPALFKSTDIDAKFDLLFLEYSGTVGESTLTVTATDSGGLSSSATFTVTVTALPKVPPTITSKLSDTGTVGVAYAYTITATGDKPLTLTASNLPAGLSVSGAVISGTPTTAGTFDIKLDATNKHGTDSKTLQLVVAPSGVTNPNLPPVISAAPTFTPSAPLANTPVTFTANATDPNNDPLTFTWDFGDSATGTGATVVHPYAVAGTFKVTVTVSDGKLSVSAEVMVTVGPPPAVPNVAPVIGSTPTFTPEKPLTGTVVTFIANATDANNDVLTYAWDFGDTTSGAGAAVDHAYSVSGTYKVTVTVTDGQLTTSAVVMVTVSDAAIVGEFNVEKASIKFSFVSDNKDSITLAGTTSIPAGFKMAGTVVRFSVGESITKVFTLSEKGSGGDRENSFKLQIKSKKGVLATTGSYTLILKNQSLLEDLSEYGFADETVSKDVTFPCVLAFDKTGYTTDVTVTYKAKKGKTGAAK